MLLDSAWLDSLLAAIQTRSTQQELVDLWRRWREEIEGHAERERIVEAFRSAKESLK